MLSTILLIYILSSVSADDGNAQTEIMPSCSDTLGTRMTFNPVAGYTGRYIAELCTERKRIFRDWELRLLFHRNVSYCNSSSSLIDTHSHSINVEWVSNAHNCSSNQTVSFISCYFVPIFRNSSPVRDSQRSLLNENLLKSLFLTQT